MISYSKQIQAITALILLFYSLHSQAQFMPMEIIHYSGSPNEVTNIVILGDGYSADEQDKFINDAQRVSREMLDQLPWNNYRDAINIFAIKVVSQESGAARDPNNLINNYFGSSFWSFDIERLLVAWRSNLASSVLFSNTPFYDIGVIMVNDPQYGGSGGFYSVFSTHEQATEIMIHELGHSFADLADEYWAGPQYARETHNMTEDTNPETIRWKDFLYENGIGIFPHEESPNWQRPHQNCKMRFLGRNFCDVCSHQLELRLDELSTPDPSIPPVAFFGADNIEIKQYDKVEFYDLSSFNPTSWEWTFEGGTPEVSNEKNPEVIYNTLGTYQVALRASNDYGENVYTRMEYISVIAPDPDTIPPVLVTKDVTIQLNKNGKATVCADDVDDGTYDDRELAKISISKENFTCEDLGTNLIIFTAIDSSGNESQGEVTITVEDNIKPTIKAKDVYIFLNDEGKAFLQPSDIDDGSFDNCGISEATLSKTEFGIKDAGKNQVTYTIKDYSSNTVSTEVMVTVDIILSNENGELPERIKLYPNPAHEMVFIEYLNNIDPTLESIEIMDVNGRTVDNIRTFERNGNLISVDVKELKSGQYFIRLKAQKSFKILRFTIQR